MWDEYKRNRSPGINTGERRPRRVISQRFHWPPKLNKSVYHYNKSERSLLWLLNIKYFILLYHSTYPCSHGPVYRRRELDKRTSTNQWVYPWRSKVVFPRNSNLSLFTKKHWRSMYLNRCYGTERSMFGQCYDITKPLQKHYFCKNCTRWFCGRNYFKTSTPLSIKKSISRDFGSFLWSSLNPPFDLLLSEDFGQYSGLLFS